MTTLTTLKKIASPLFLIVLLLSCGTGENTRSNNYFDSDNFFNQQIAFLNNAHAKLFITASANANTDQKENLNPDWERELVEFKNSDIHKNTFTGRYTVDTSVVKTISDTSILITYTAKEEGLKIRKMEVYLSPKNRSVKRVHVISYSKNFLSNLSQELDYIVNKGYSIYSSEGTKFMGTDVYEVKADFELGAGYFQ